MRLPQGKAPRVSIFSKQGGRQRTLGTVVCDRLQYDLCQPRTFSPGKRVSNPRERFVLQRPGFSPGEMPQAPQSTRTFYDHRIRDAEDYKHHHTYIWQNPVKAGLSERPELFTRSSAALGMELDAPPPGLKP
jgi:hypothetical protein